MMMKPQGRYHGEGWPYRSCRQRFVATGEFRPPKAGEHYLSGAIIEAYRACTNFTTAYWIARPFTNNAASV